MNNQAAIETLERLCAANRPDDALAAANALYEQVAEAVSERVPLDTSDPELAGRLLAGLKELPAGVCDQRVVRRLYEIEGMITDLHQLYREDSADPHYVLGRIRRKRLLGIAAGLPAADRAKVLDLGCADGTYFFPLSEHCASVTGVDVSAERLERLRSRAPDANVHCLDLNADRLPVESGSVSMVLATEVIEHIHAVDHLFSEINRVLRAGGILLSSIPNRGSISRRIESMRDGDATDHSSWFHPNDWTIRDYRSILRRHGFGAVRAWGIGYRIPKARRLLGHEPFQTALSRVSVLAPVAEDLIVQARKSGRAYS